jgi:hypothetical protein
MIPHHLRAWAAGLAAAISLLWSQPLPAQDIPKLPDPLPKAENPPGSGIEIQGRGPIHEGFAQPQGEAKPGAIVPKQPPAPVPEEPAEQKPDGDVQWIPGYWAWDSDRNDFLWVSGFWRKAPVGRKWVPGHWVQADEGWQWVSGFWAEAAQPDVQYLQNPPPASLDEGPSTPAPDDNSLYVPGAWIPRAGSYYWRAGYWAEPIGGYIWTPASYSWTPLGYLYTSGFWDYDLYNRGLLFAPVYFTNPFWTWSNWFFRPWWAINTVALFPSLWVGHHHYWFGDYYHHYAHFGFRPWYAYGAGRFNDPLFSYYRWYHRNNYASWYGGLRNTFNGRVNGTIPVPPRTITNVNVNNRTTVNNFGNRNNTVVSNNTLVQPLNQFSNDRFRLTTTSASQMATQRTNMERFHEVAQQRQRLERVGAAADSQARLSLNGLPTGRPAPSVTPRSNTLGGTLSNPGLTRPRPEVSNSSPFTRPRGDFGSEARPRINAPNHVMPQMDLPRTDSRGRSSFASPDHAMPQMDLPRIDSHGRPSFTAPSPSRTTPRFDARPSSRPSFSSPSLNRPSPTMPSRPSATTPSFNRPSFSSPSMNRPSMPSAGGNAGGRGSVGGNAGGRGSVGGNAGSHSAPSHGNSGHNRR